MTNSSSLAFCMCVNEMNNCIYLVSSDFLFLIIIVCSFIHSTGKVFLGSFVSAGLYAKLLTFVFCFFIFCCLFTLHDCPVAVFNPVVLFWQVLQKGTSWCHHVPPSYPQHEHVVSSCFTETCFLAVWNVGSCWHLCVLYIPNSLHIYNNNK